MDYKNALIEAVKGHMLRRIMGEEKRDLYFNREEGKFKVIDNNGNETEIGSYFNYCLNNSWEVVITEPKFNVGDVVVSLSTGSIYIVYCVWGDRYRCSSSAFGQMKCNSLGLVYTAVREFAEEDLELYNPEQIKNIEQ